MAESILQETGRSWYEHLPRSVLGLVRKGSSTCSTASPGDASRFMMRMARVRSDHGAIRGAYR